MVGKLVEEFNKTIEAKLTEIALFEHKNGCVCFCTVALGSVLILFTINTWLSCYHAKNY